MKKNPMQIEEFMKDAPTVWEQMSWWHRVFFVVIFPIHTIYELITGKSNNVWDMPTQVILTVLLFIGMAILIGMGFLMR